MKEETINAIVNYLITKPYAEVAGLIAMIQQDLAENKEEIEVR